MTGLSGSNATTSARAGETRATASTAPNATRTGPYGSSRHRLFQQPVHRALVYSDLVSDPSSWPTTSPQPAGHLPPVLTRRTPHRDALASGLGTLVCCKAAGDAVRKSPRSESEALSGHGAARAHRFSRIDLHQGRTGHTDREEQFRVGVAAGCPVPPITSRCRQPAPCPPGHHAPSAAWSLRPVAEIGRISPHRYQICTPVISLAPVSLFRRSLAMTPTSKSTSWTGL